MKLKKFILFIVLAVVLNFSMHSAAGSGASSSASSAATETITSRPSTATTTPPMSCVQGAGDAIPSLVLPLAILSPEELINKARIKLNEEIYAYRIFKEQLPETAHSHLNAHLTVIRAADHLEAIVGAMMYLAHLTNDSKDFEELEKLQELYQISSAARERIKRARRKLQPVALGRTERSSPTKTFGDDE